MTKKTFKIKTLGCKVNQYESSLLRGFLSKLGLEEVEKNADYVIINTCSVTKSAIYKDKRAVNRAKKDSPDSQIFLFGCLARVDEKTKENMNVDGVSESIEPKEIIHDFGLNGLLKGKKINNENFADFDRTRYFIKIQDGCEQFCSYCIIPYVRGKMKSRNTKEVVEEIEKAVSRGYKEIVLSGIHIGLFGRESSNNENTSLVKLLEKIIKIKGDFRVRISSIEITEINDNLIALINRSDKICKHLHISLQSGSDAILDLMNRPYTKSYFEGVLKKIRNVIPDIAISTDIIVGFPGETEKHFKETYDFAKDTSFSGIHVFSFSAHEITKAFSMENQNDTAVIKKRAEKLRILSSVLEKKYFKGFKSKELLFLLERKGDGLIGRSEYHFEIKINKKLINTNIDMIQGNMVKIKIKI